MQAGRGFVGLARALRWAGPGSLRWVGLGGAKPGLPGEPDECFVLGSSFSKYFKRWLLWKL